MTSTEGRWFRIPLIGDVEGVVLLLPDELISEENWGHMMAILAAAKPGLTRRATEPETPEPAP